MNGDGAARFTGQANTDTVHAGPLVIDLVTRARNGGEQSWDALVERYTPLIWLICRRYRLSRADAEDVGQSVWLRLVDQLDKVRDPAALPGSLATTTPRECGRVLRPRTARTRQWPRPREPPDRAGRGRRTGTARS